MGHRINLYFPDDLLARFNEWRSKQFAENGQIPNQTDAARILIHRALLSEEMKEPE